MEKVYVKLKKLLPGDKFCIDNNPQVFEITSYLPPEGNTGVYVRCIGYLQAKEQFLKEGLMDRVVLMEQTNGGRVVPWSAALGTRQPQVIFAQEGPAYLLPKSIYPLNKKRSLLNIHLDKKLDRTIQKHVSKAALHYCPSGDLGLNNLNWRRIGGQQRVAFEDVLFTIWNNVRIQGLKD